MRSDEKDGVRKKMTKRDKKQPVLEQSEPVLDETRSTTIQIPTGMKTELEDLKEDEREPYAGVIRRLIDCRDPPESDEETVHLTLPRRIYKLILMLLPGNLRDQVLQGVK